MEKIRLSLSFLADDLHDAKLWSEVNKIEERLRKIIDMIEEGE